MQSLTEQRNMIIKWGFKSVQALRTLFRSVENGFEIGRSKSFLYFSYGFPETALSVCCSSGAMLPVFSDLCQQKQLLSL